jgi:DNA-binding FrmR family transcriptional regulator
VSPRTATQVLVAIAALALALDAAMHIVVQHGVAARVADADHEARIARLCEYLPPGGWP